MLWAKRLETRTAVVLWILICLGGQRSLALEKIVTFVPDDDHWADVGLAATAGYDLALEDGLLPRTVRLIVEECNDSLDLRELLVELAGDQDVLMFLGGMPGYNSAIIAESAEQAGIPYLIDFNANDALTRVPRHWVFRLTPPASEFNSGSLSWALTVAGKGRHSAIVSDGVSHRFQVEDLRDDLSHHWSGTTEVVEFSPGTVEFHPIIETLRSSDPALIWLSGSTTDISRFLRQCRQFDYTPFGFLLVGVDQVNSKLISASEGTAQFIIGPMLWNRADPKPEVRRFIDRFEDVNGEPPDYHSVLAYSAIEIIGTILKERIPSREQLRQQLSTGDFNTLFGPVRFEEYASYYQQNRSRAAACQLKGDAWELIWPIQVTASDDIYPIPGWRERRDRLDFQKSQKTDLILLGIAFGGIAGLIILRMTSARSRES
jgi:branched-chain amino acid transport system substrate-binding protein